MLTEKPSRFLLASLHVDSLVSKKTTSRLNSALNSLSHGSGALGDAYNKAIDRIDGQVHDDCTLAKSVLSWISYAQRPLTTKELCHALAVEIGDEDFDSENVTDVEDILSVCAGLVTVDEESQIIRLVHYTTQEYLEGIREAWHPRAQHEIASTCLTYLCFEPFKSGPCPYETDSENRRKKYSLLDYSARYWPEHAAAVQEEICDLAMVLLQDSNLVASAHLHGHGGCPYSLRRQVTGLHLTASSELLHLSRELLSWAKKERMDLANSRDSMGATPLSYAAEGGYKEIVQLLLGTDTVDVDGEDEFGFTPLLYAVKHSHKELVELLLGTGKVDVNAKQRDGWTALLLAVTAGQKEIVELLLGTGKVDVNAKQRDGWTALLLAVNRQQKEIFKLLLGTRKVDVNAKERDGRTALMIAVMEGLREIVELLLDAGKVDAEAKSHGWTPVFVAVREGHKEIVELLLGPGKADVDKTPDRSTLLRYAVGCGYKDLAEFLLGINTDASNITDRWPLLSLVAANRHRSIAELIGSEEIDLDAKLGFEGRTLLMQTTRQRRGDFVAMLLKAGAKSNAKDIDGSTALMEAAEIGGKEVAELLLNAGADIDAKDEEGSTALMMAALKGHQSMVELLLDRGADVHVKNKKGSTAPMEAARHSKKETLELLLDRGADVHAKNEDGLTALIVAARWGHEDTVELLLNKGADVHAQKKNGLTALMAAAKHDQKGIAKLLLDRGIDVHAQKTNGSTALMLAERRRHKDTADFLRAHISYL
jgi:ankyrin repeat protein